MNNWSNQDELNEESFLNVFFLNPVISTELCELNEWSNEKKWVAFFGVGGLHIKEIVLSELIALADIHMKLPEELCHWPVYRMQIFNQPKHKHLEWRGWSTKTKINFAFPPWNRLSFKNEFDLTSFNGFFLKWFFFISR